MNLLYHIIEKKVEKLCKGEYQTEFLIILRQWIDAHVLPYAIIILAQDRENCEVELSEKVVENNRNYNESNNKNNNHNNQNDNNNDNNNNDVSNELKLKILLHNCVLSALSKFRAYELFEIVADYPESYMAIKELKEAANSSITGILPYIGKVFKEVVCKRLLHTGASTSQILDMYISMIRALRALDTSDLLLNFVAAPVRGYLLGREDTVRCVVASLTQAKDSDLHGELRRGGSLEYGDDEEDEEKGPGENWEPRKRDRDFSGEGVRGLDVLALLVSLYGSTDLFVTEYRSLLADKLLTNLLYNTDEELGTLELLKVRFGEEKLHSCEVMLRDTEESKRVNNAIACEIKKTHASKPSRDKLSISDNIDMEPSIIDCIMISDNYWPTLQNNEFTHHPLALESITIYQETYTLLKKPRKLDISTQLGIVELELDFKDGSTRMFYAGPIQATLIMYLSEENINGYSSVELSEKCDVEEADVRRKMMFWISKGVVKEVQVDEDDVRYEVIEEQELNAQRDLEAISGGLVTGNDELIQDTIGGSAGVASEIQMKSIMIVFEKYVKGMLKSHDSMPLERIHAMLKLLASGGEGNEAKYDMNMVQLRKFMQTLIDRDELEYFDNLYRIRK
jgi:anaphase-promoting complex subunit 2